MASKAANVLVVSEFWGAQSVVVPTAEGGVMSG